MRVDEKQEDEESEKDEAKQPPTSKKRKAKVPVTSKRSTKTGITMISLSALMYVTDSLLRTTVHIPNFFLSVFLSGGGPYAIFLFIRHLYTSYKHA